MKSPKANDPQPRDLWMVWDNAKGEWDMMTERVVTAFFSEQDARAYAPFVTSLSGTEPTIVNVKVGAFARMPKTHALERQR